MNRIAVVSMIKNEADIVESSIRHWSLFADKIFIRDHKSTDRTRKIIESLKDEGLPIEVETFNHDEFMLSEVITSLMYHAFDEGFDLVLPLDCDEFPIFIDGNSENLREHLQNLDKSHGYRTYCWEHRFADEDYARYALSRTIVRAKSFNPGLPKVIVGKDLAMKHEVSISFGNHSIVFKDHPQNYQVLDDTQILYAHFSYRGGGQSTSKRILNYLGVDLQVTRYNARKENSSPQQMADNYFGENPPKIDLTDYLPTDLSAYRDECELKFSGGGGVNPGHALFLLASSYVKTLVRERILRQREVVRIFLLYDGEVDLAIRSLESCFEQIYPHKKIFIVLLTTKNVGELILAMKDRAAEVEFVDRSEFRNKLETPEGSYVQFVTAGDVLDHDKLLHMVELNHSEHNTEVAFSAIKPFEHKNLPTEFDPPIEKSSFPHRGYWLVWGIHGNVALDLLTNQKQLLISGLTRGFFRQGIFQNAWWIQNWLDVSNFELHNVESSAIFPLANLIVNRNIFFLDENLVEHGSRDWIDRDFWVYQNLCQQIAKRLKG